MKGKKEKKLKENKETLLPTGVTKLHFLKIQYRRFAKYLSSIQKIVVLNLHFNKSFSLNWTKIFPLMFLLRLTIIKHFFSQYTNSLNIKMI